MLAAQVVWSVPAHRSDDRAAPVQVILPPDCAQPVQSPAVDVRVTPLGTVMTSWTGPLTPWMFACTAMAVSSRLPDTCSVIEAGGGGGGAGGDDGGGGAGVVV